MKIALLGYGKMGKMIEQIALDRKHDIVLKIDKDNLHELTADNLQQADVAIEFSTPSTVLSNIELSFKAGVPIVVGTTGWHNEMGQIKEQCAEHNASMIYGTNFSVGVNIFFHVNRLLARIMNNYPYYEVQVEEIHHTQKLDSPSGTAITIAEGIIDSLDAKNQWKNVLISDSQPDNETVAPEEVLIESLRIENVPGTHTVIYDSEVDTLEFKHTAHNRNGFALGAVLAAEWIKDKKGFHAIEEMFDFNK
ncbi:4-hydroxy-tetrahydrodipicolinate reductase [Mucilaginibacter sp.]|uniref:4-hydroxy-tetrahydrodipicolinate reductase n=1 Tax=Mucilaginibacter sp. TaxID=1882438 RepID=UPI000CC4448F|nr:4-hydroxy-tetrahydrodipicolinate reductase [Mucilaginibacter sp.]PLW90432.1 MAG: 4-hydroxy-tetrahydrodipicolinate reductase [Mucilaginibacter sp.]HEK20177.1 4-hydroxy-tetrahydrodipicolinate reductase [Bacteroidota bacterium]